MHIFVDITVMQMVDMDIFLLILQWCKLLHSNSVIKMVVHTSSVIAGKCGYLHTVVAIFASITSTPHSATWSTYILPPSYKLASHATSDCKITSSKILTHNNDKERIYILLNLFQLNPQGKILLISPRYLHLHCAQKHF